MASIERRHDKFRLRIRPEGLPLLSLTFSTHEDAKVWAEYHEDEYISNPWKYQRWIKLNRQSIRENGIFHIYIPLEKF